MVQTHLTCKELGNIENESHQSFHCYEFTDPVGLHVYVISPEEREKSASLLALTCTQITGKLIPINLYYHMREENGMPCGLLEGECSSHSTAEMLYLKTFEALINPVGPQLWIWLANIFKPPTVVEVTDDE